MASLRTCDGYPKARSYHRTTIYLTEEQRQWLTRLAAQARLEGSTISASDVIRYASTSLQEHLPEDELTQREREVLALVGQGLSNQGVAGQLVISPAIVRTHVGRAMVKLGARGRAQLVVACQPGLVGPGPAPRRVGLAGRRGPRQSTGTVW